MTHVVTKLKVVTLWLGLLAIVLVGAFFLTKGSPSEAELAYAEHSLFGKSGGSVIPASCDSNPPFSHFASPYVDCPKLCSEEYNVPGEPWYNPKVAQNTVYSPASNSCVCNPNNPATAGRTNPPDCNRPAVNVSFTETDNSRSNNPLRSVSLTASEYNPICYGTRLSPNCSKTVTLSWELTGDLSGFTCTRDGVALTAAEVNRRSGSWSVTKNSNYMRSSRHEIKCTDGSEVLSQTIYVYWELERYSSSGNR